MYVPKSKPSVNLAARSLQSTKLPAGNKASVDLIQPQVIPAQIVSIGGPIAYTGNLPAGVLSNALLDSLAVTSVIENKSQAVDDERILSVPSICQ